MTGYKRGLRHVSKRMKSRQKEIPLGFDKPGSVMSGGWCARGTLSPENHRCQAEFINKRAEN